MKKKLIKILSIAMTVLLSVACLVLGASCKDDYELYGFTPKAEITVKQGDFVQSENFYIFDSKENYYEVSYKVLDADDARVILSNDGFFAKNTSGYKIVYTVTTVNGIYTQTTLVNVTPDTTQNELNVYVPTTAKKDEPCTITIDETDKQTYTFSITVTYNGAPITVENETFTPTESGEYAVTVTATGVGEPITKTYTVIVGEKMIEGEVEKFDESWTNYRGEWSVATTEETSLKDRYGNDGSYLFTQTEERFTAFYVMPANERSYYEALAEKGYEYVSLWIYLDCELAHVVQQFKGYGTLYQNSQIVQPKTWTEIRYNLQDDPKKDFEGSFLKAFDFYASQSQRMITVDNSDEYNGANGGQERDEHGEITSFKIYVDDIYAVKKGADISLDTTVTPNVTVGETYDLTNLIDSTDKDELFYTVNFRGETYIADSGEFTFTASGDYTVTAQYATSTPNLYGKVSTDITVIPPYKATYKSLYPEYKNTPLSVSLGDLNVSLIDKNGQKLNNVTLDYTVTKNGEAVEVESNAFTVDGIGCYDVTVKATYLVGETPCFTYMDIVVDAWNREIDAKYVDITASDRIWSWNYTGERRAYSSVYKVEENAEIGGKTGEMLVYTGTQQRPSLQYNPVHSKAYYEYILKCYPSAKVTVDVYVTVEGKTSGNVQIAGIDKVFTKYDLYTWYTLTIPLSDIINNFEALQISTIGSSQAKQLLYIQNSYYNSGYRNFNVYYAGFGYELGAPNEEYVSGVPEKDESIGNDIFE